MTVGPDRLVRGSARRPWSTIAIWVLLLVTSGVLSQLLGDALTSEITFTNQPESAKALEVIEDLRGDEAPTEFVVVKAEGAVANDSHYPATSPGSRRG